MKKTFEKIILKNNRIGLLSNSYLANGALKLRISCTTKFLGRIITSLQSENLIPIHAFSENVPHHKIFSQFVLNIQNDLIKEMDLGYESLNWNEVDNYFENEFKKDLNIS